MDIVDAFTLEMGVPPNEEVRAALGDFIGSDGARHNSLPRPAQPPHTRLQCWVIAWIKIEKRVFLEGRPVPFACDIAIRGWGLRVKIRH